MPIVDKEFRDIQNQLKKDREILLSFHCLKKNSLEKIIFHIIERQEKVLERLEELQGQIHKKQDA